MDEQSDLLHKITSLFYFVDLENRKNEKKNLTFEDCMQ